MIMQTSTPFKNIKSLMVKDVHAFEMFRTRSILGYLPKCDQRMPGEI